MSVVSLRVLPYRPSTIAVACCPPLPSAASCAATRHNTATGPLHQSRRYRNMNEEAGKASSSLHDALAVGFDGQWSASKQEVELRLPLLMKLLSDAHRRLAPDEAIISCLEDAASANPADSDNVERLVNLAAKLLRRIEELTTSVSREPTGAGDSTRFDWDTNNLDVAIQRLECPEEKANGERSECGAKRTSLDTNAPGVGEVKKKRRRLSPMSQRMELVVEVLENDPALGKQSSENDDDDDEDFLQLLAKSAENSSDESLLTRLLRELIGLVKLSLKSAPTDDATSSNLPLSETELHRLVVVLPVLMEHAPLLRHGTCLEYACFSCHFSNSSSAPTRITDTYSEHVASALCRAEVPHSPKLIESMGANCPPATSCLLRGCISAYRLAKQNSRSAENESVKKLAVESTRLLASLSKREAMNVICVLRREKIMEGLTLSLLLDHDPIGAAAFIVEMMTRTVNGTANDAKTLRRRMEKNKHPSFSKEPTENQLKTELTKDGALAAKATELICQRIVAIYSDAEASGEAALFIKAFSLLPRNSLGPNSKPIEEVMLVIQSAATVKNARKGTLPDTSENDNLYSQSMALCCVTKGNPTDSHFLACGECLLALIRHPQSRESFILSSRLAGCLVHNDTKTIAEIMVGILNADSVESNERQLMSLCEETARENEDELRTIFMRGLELSTVMYDPIVAIETLRRSSSRYVNELDSLMKAILCSPDLCTQVAKSRGAHSLIQESVKMLLRRPGPRIPCVLPLSLESLSHKIPWAKVADERSAQLLLQLSLQVIYALEFAALDPSSPFIVQVRNLPLRELLSFIERGDGIDLKPLATCLKRLVSKHCPDYVHRRVATPIGAVATPNKVRESIMKSFQDGAFEIVAEKTFLSSRSIYPHQDVDLAAVNALLSSGVARHQVYSYLALCQDPLGLMKAPAKVWRLKGLRCILVRVLKDLLGANECIVTQSAKSQNVATDYLTARDAIIVKCVVFASSSGFVMGGSDPSARPKYCMQCISLVRFLVSRRRGIIASLAKDGLSGSCLSWITQFIPESILDAPMMMKLLHVENNLLTATQCVCLACAGVQIGVMHFERNEKLAFGLICACNLVMVNSGVALSVGLVGIPVACLREDGGSQNITDICREALFRLIRVLSSIDPKKTSLRNEASLTLSRLASKAKSESSAGGIAGVAAARRKAGLKQIWDACVQANTAIGGSAQL